ncbi:MAG: hypothetical protein RR547_07335 [Raoultibacter sp.]
MLGKLLKYDMKALSRVLIPVHCAALVAGIGAIICFGGMFAVSNGYRDFSSPSSGSETALLITCVMTGVFCLFALFMASATTLFTLIYRFYKNLFSDEGYLTLTLPVSASMHVASKVIAGMIWFFVDILVVGSCAYFASMAATGFSGDVTETIPYVMLTASLDFSSLNTVGWYLIAGFNALLQVLTALLTAYAAFSLGSALASRHKVAAGIAFYFLLSWGAGLFHSIKSLFFMTNSAMNGFGEYQINTMLSVGISMILYVITCVAFFALCTYVLDRKTNLA